MLIFWRLILAHLLADFTFQSDYINSWKKRSIQGLLVHCATHFVISAMLTFPYISSVWIDTGWIKLHGWTCISILVVIHLLQDEWRMYTMRRFKTADCTVYFAWDQVIHAGFIFLFSPIYGMLKSGSFLPEKWVVLAAIAVGVTHALTVFVYFIEKDLYNAEFPNFDEKYLVIGERLVLWGFFLLPNYWWAPFSILWIGHMFYLRRRRTIDFSRVGFYLGLSMTFLFGFLARWVYWTAV